MSKELMKLPSTGKTWYLDSIMIMAKRVSEYLQSAQCWIKQETKAERQNGDNVRMENIGRQNED